MNWTEELLEVYEKNRDQAGVIHYKKYKIGKEEQQIPYVLLPPFHTTVTAQVEIKITENGELLNAEKVADVEKSTVIPVTEKSGSRTAGKAAHPLCDNLQYIAGDFGDYTEKQKEGNECFELYLSGLERWYFSEYTHPKVAAIYRYIKKGKVIEDLIRYKVLVLDENGKLDSKVKWQGVSQDKYLVRFVITAGVTDEIIEEACWKDRSLQECFIQYYNSIQETRDLDYLSGQWEAPSYLQPKKIRNEGDGAKLISANDEVNFTFRGRFSSKEQAFSIGSETSQKIHNALKWLIRKQGHSFDTMYMVAWESDMHPILNWDADTEQIISTANRVSDKAEDDFEEEYEEEEPFATDTNPIVAEQLYQALQGYRKKVHNTSRMVLMVLDGATPGRLAIQEFKALETAQYLDNIYQWHERGGWQQQKKKNHYYYGVPGIKDIADILYGSDGNAMGSLTINDKNGKRMYAELGRRLEPCIWSRRNLPYDLVQIAVNRASMPQSYKHRTNWEQTLCLACSFVKKNRYERYKEEWNVALDEICNDRSYLYGRLLAVADQVEYRTFEQDSERMTNAKRYMTTFSQRPFETWKIIEENIQPYWNHLKVSERNYYRKVLDEIYALFEVDAFKEKRRLDGLYLLGFHSQMFELKKKKNNQQEEKGHE